MSRFGDLVKRLRKEKGLTLEAVAKKLGSHKGYVSGIENDKVNPPSVKMLKKYAKIFGCDARGFIRLAWVDKAPDLIKDEAQRFLAWCESQDASSKGEDAPGAAQRQLKSEAMP